MTLLTPDNPQLSRLKTPDFDGLATSQTTAPSIVEACYAINCTALDTNDLPAEVAQFVQAGVANATRRAYRADLDHFAAWGGDLPADALRVASYLAAHADALSVATLVRRSATISKAHDARGWPNPCRSELVRSTMRGIKRVLGTRQREAKPLLRDDLLRVLDALQDSTRDVRDRALLLVGFAGAFRRSELCAINCVDVEIVRQGMVIHLKRSKTDQEGAGRKIGIPLGRGRHCPVLALENWLKRGGVETEPVFRPVDRHGRIASDRLSGWAVSRIVKERVAAVGIDPVGYSGHSLRAGFATSAVQAGASTLNRTSPIGRV